MVNHVFDHKLAIELLYHNTAEIRELYKHKPMEGEQGFLHPIVILEKIGPASNRKRYYSTSQNENSHDILPRNGRSTNSVDYEEEDEEEKLEYRPKLPQSESYSSPGNKEKSETFSKNYLSESRDEPNSRKISDFDQIIDTVGHSEGLEVASGRHFVSTAVMNGNYHENQDNDYEDLIADIADYVHTDQPCNLWEDTEPEQDSQCNFYDDIMKQNLQYLNDMNEISDEDTAHLNQSSNRSMTDDSPLPMQDHCRAWALDELDEDMVAQSGLCSPPKFISSANKELLPFLESFNQPPVKEEPTPSLPEKPLPKAIPSKPIKATPVEQKAKEVKAHDSSAIQKQQKMEACPSTLRERQAIEDLLPKADNLILMGQKPDAKPKLTASAEAALKEEEKINLFMSRAQKKKEREAKKKKNRKLKQEEQKLNANQDSSLPSDSIDVSCIQKKQSKFEHSDEEKEICKMIEDPISQTFLKNENFTLENPLIKAALDVHEPIPQEAVEKIDKEDAQKTEGLEEEDNEDKKAKKKKKKKKKVEANPALVGNKNKLSGFQEKLMQEQTVKDEKMTKQQSSKESKTELAGVQPSSLVVEPQIDVEFELAKSLSKVRGPSGLDSIFKMMDLIDSSHVNRVVIDSFSCDYACKFLFATCAK